MLMDEIEKYWENLPEEEKEKYWNDTIEHLYRGIFKMWLESTNGVLPKESDYDN